MIRIASQLPAGFNDSFRTDAVDIVAVPPGATELDAGIEVLIAAPFRRPGDPCPPRPAGWPFDLRWIQLVSVGIDAYPEWLFDGPVVTSARGSSAVALAEFALAAIFAHAKRLPDIWVHDRQDWTPTPLASLAGSTLGLVGFGAIGEALAPRAQALGMRVLATRRSDRPLSPGVERADLATLFAQADTVVLAAPATAETERMIDATLLASAKPDLHLINIARGLLIDDDALLAALDAGRIARATLDVTYPEPLPAGHRYYTHPRVRLSPHTSVHTADTRRNIALGFAANLERFRHGLPLADVVDIARGY
jgi:phosphoglycerate dehydrogenase-like enzyme